MAFLQDDNNIVQFRAQDQLHSYRLAHVALNGLYPCFSRRVCLHARDCLQSHSQHLDTRHSRKLNTSQYLVWPVVEQAMLHDTNL